MNSKDEALRMAIEAMQVLIDNGGIGSEDMFDDARDAVRACKSALESRAIEAAHGIK